MSKTTRPRSREPHNQYYKTFTYAVIRDKVAKRTNVPEYHDMLMACAVTSDDAGVTFDTSSKEWRRLVERCEEVDELERKAKDTKEAATSRSASASSTLNNHNLSARPPPLHVNGASPISANDSPQISGHLPTPPIIPSRNRNGTTSPAPPTVEELELDGWIRLNRIPTVRRKPSRTGSILHTPPQALLTSPTTGPPLPVPPASARSRADFHYVADDRAFEKRLLSELTQSDEDLRERIHAEREADREREGRRRDSSEIGRDEDALSVVITLAKGALNGQAIDVSILRQNCRMVGIPSKYRAIIWAVLLKDPSLPKVGISTPDNLNKHSDLIDSQSPTGLSPVKPASSDSAASTKFDMSNQRVVRADIERTFAHCETFQSPPTRHIMEVILTEYCKANSIGYKQGMNYLLAPFLLIGLNSPTEIYTLYSTFIARFLPNTFTDEEFGALQCIFTLFRLLLLHHDPELATLLDQHEIGPELYASSWFITLFTNRCNIDVMYHLWDELILELKVDALLHYYVSLALLISHRSMLIKENLVMLPETLSKITFHSKMDVNNLIYRAKKVFRTQTSGSIQERLHMITSRKISLDSDEYRLLTSWPCLHVTAEEVVGHLYSEAGLTPTTAMKGDHSSNSSKSGGHLTLKYFILDCRPLEMFESGHLPCAFHLNPLWLLKSRELEAQLDALTAMKGSHFCLMGTGAEPLTFDNYAGRADTPLHRFVSLLVKRGFKYVSICSGGYASCHSLIMQARTHGVELVDHKKSQCVECQGGIRDAGSDNVSASSSTPSPSQSIGWIESMRKMAGTMMVGVLDHLDNLDIMNASYPPSTTVLPDTLHMRLLLTVVKDTQCEPVHFVESMHQLTVHIVQAVIDKELGHEKRRKTANGELQKGWECSMMTTLCLSSIADNLLNQAWLPYTTTARRSHAYVAWENKNQPSISPSGGEGSSSNQSRDLVDIELPDGVANMNVLIFASGLNVSHGAEISALINELLARGIQKSSIQVATLFAARGFLWELHLHHPYIRILCCCVQDDPVSVTPRNSQSPVSPPVDLHLDLQQVDERYLSAITAAAPRTSSPKFDNSAPKVISPS